MQIPAWQASVAPQVSPVVVPHPPQLFGSFCVSTQTPPQQAPLAQASFEMQPAPFGSDPGALSQAPLRLVKLQNVDLGGFYLGSRTL